MRHHGIAVRLAAILLSAVCLLVVFLLASAFAAGPARAAAVVAVAEPAAAEGELGAVAADQLAGIDTADFESFLAELNRETQGLLPAFSLRDILAGLTGGGFKANAEALLQGIVRLFCREVLANTGLLGELIALAALCALLQNLQSAFEGETVGKVAYAICYLVLATLAVGAFAVSLNAGRAVISNLVRFMQILTPLLLTLLAALGGITTTPLFHGIVVLIINVVAVAVRDIILPLLLVSAIVDVVGNLVEGWKLSHLTGFIRQAATVTLGVLLCTFVGVMLVSGAVGAVGDGVALRTAKFMANTFVPVVGKMFADSAELVIGGSLILKNAVGIAGTIAIFLVCAFPLIKLIAVILIFRFAAALVQPINPGRISECLNGLAGSLSLVCVSVGAVAMMFFFSTAIIVAAGNFMTMIR